MADSQNERLYNLFNRVTVVTTDTYIDISTATNVMNCVEPALHCTDKQLIGALNEFNYPILDTLLGRHRLIGINIRPEYIQYMTELDKMYRKSNPSLVYTFLNKDQTLKGILDTHVVKAKSNKSVITKDQMIKMLSGYAKRYPESKNALKSIYNDNDKFLYQMHQFFGVDLVEETTNYKWYIRGWVAKYEYINSRPIELDWQKDAFTVDDLTQALEAAAEPEPEEVKLPVSKPVAIHSKVVEYSLKDCFGASGMAYYEQRYIQPALEFFTWLESVSRFANTASSFIGETRLMKAYSYYVSAIDRAKGIDIRNAKTARLVKSVQALKDFENRYGLKLPKIMSNLQIGKKGKMPTMSITKWAIPSDTMSMISSYKEEFQFPETNTEEPEVVEPVKPKIAPITHVAVSHIGTAMPTMTSTSASAMKTPDTGKVLAPEASSTATRKNDVTKPDESIARRVAAVCKQFNLFKDANTVTKSINTGYEVNILDFFTVLKSNELGIRCMYNGNEPVIDFVAKYKFGMSKVATTSNSITFTYSEDPKLYGSMVMKIYVDKNQVAVTYPEEAYPYGFAIPNFVEDVLKLALYYYNE